MEREPVSSENIASIGYENGTLEVEFTSGRVYQYFDVPEHVFEELMRADSHGRFFNQQVRGQFRYARV
jgi:KTSC domain